MSDPFMTIMMIVIFIVVNITVFFLPETWQISIQSFSLEHWYLGPLLLLFAVIGVPLILVYKTSRDSGVPFRICLQSLLEYLSGDPHTKRMSTLKLAQNEKELEENK